MPLGKDRCLSSFWLCSAFGRAVSSNATVWCVVGFLVAADGAYYAATWMLKQQRRRRRHLRCSASSALCPDVCAREGSAESVHHYWTRLSDAILQSPRALVGNAKHCRTLPADSGHTLPEAVRCLWEGRVHYLLDEREVFTLLRRAARGETIMGGDELISVASLALLWRLQLVNFVHDAIAVDEDVSECNDSLASLDEHSDLFYQTCIHPLEAFLPSVSLVFVKCWFSLSEELHELRQRRFTLQIRNVWSLAKYVYASGREKMFSCPMMAVLTAAAAHSASAGLALRERVERLLEVTLNYVSTSSPDGGSTSLHTCIGVLAGFLTLEWARLVTTAAVVRVTEGYIRSSASCHRNSVKQQLYEALVRTPLKFFDMRDLDDVERLMYYANDLEGVDVHVHDFFAGMVRAVTAFLAVAVVLDRRSCAIVLATVAASDLLTGSLTLLRKRCAVDIDDEDEDVDAEERENGNLATDGVMLRGMEIIEHIHELRPYGADAALMTWWVKHTAQNLPQTNSLLRMLRAPLRFRRLWAIDALVSLVKWLLPVIVTTHAAASFMTRGTFIEAMLTARGLLDQTLDAPRVVEVVLSNAYKVNALERILDARHWEEEEEEERSGEKERTVVCTTMACPAVTDDGDAGAKREALLRLDADVEVARIRAVDLQFQYPTAPTVDAFRSPVSFDVRLQDNISGVGRLVCVTGPSGCGKTTLLRLLLALYTTKSKGSLSVQLRRRGSHVADHPQTESQETGDGKREDDALWFPVASIGRKILRSQLFGFVPQTSTLFPGATIAHNISLQNRVSVANALLLSRVRECAEAAACVEFIDRLPQGLLTPLSAATGWVTPGAVRLSCGQGQRLMLARALFHGGGVLLMDEPTSGLDAASKAAVLTQLRELLRSGRLRGVLCVTHDSEVLGQADHVVRL